MVWFFDLFSVLLVFVFVFSADQGDFLSPWPPEQGGGKRAPLQPPEDRMGNGVSAFDLFRSKKTPSLLGWGFSRWAVYLFSMR